jgi:hypothetical protein
VGETRGVAGTCLLNAADMENNTHRPVRRIVTLVAVSTALSALTLFTTATAAGSGPWYR